MNMNFQQSDKEHIASEKYHDYTYYEFTEDSLRSIAGKSPKEASSKELYSLVQMLYPHNLICSGLFDRVLVFDIKNGKRVDPPKEAYSDFADRRNGAMLLERILDAFKEAKFDVHEGWALMYSKAREK